MDTVGGWLAGYLKARGIDTLFTLTGGHIFPLLDGCLDAGVRVVDTRHEQAAAFAAEGWALRTGRPAAYLVTAGPGFANAVAGLADKVIALNGGRQYAYGKPRDIFTEDLFKNVFAASVVIGEHPYRDQAMIIPC